MCTGLLTSSVYTKEVLLCYGRINFEVGSSVSYTIEFNIGSIYKITNEVRIYEKRLA